MGHVWLPLTLISCVCMIVFAIYCDLTGVEVTPLRILYVCGPFAFLSVFGLLLILISAFRT